MKNRIWTLYRVSTKGQMTKDEIPTQRHQCKKYIDDNKEWELFREVSENGVSGFKNKAEDREVLQTILSGAINKEFDILLVYKADRLGRLGIDTLSYLMQLWEYGVKAYSTVEGYLNVETVNARIMTGLYFHLSEGESTSTSQRVSDFMAMYNEEGKYMGGTPPYGYKVIDTGIEHWKKKDKSIKELAVNDDEAEIVKIIFDLAYSKGLGAGRITHYLNEHQYRTRTEGNWRQNVVGRILRNPMYIGLKRYGTVDKHKHLKSRDDFKFQPKKQELAIIDEKVFWDVQAQIDNRLTRDYISTNNRPNPTSSKLLLAGIARCGYCNTLLKADYSNKYHTKTNGERSVYKISRYACNDGKSKMSDHEAVSFGAKKYEEQVEKLVKEFIKNLDADLYRNEAKTHFKKKLNELTKEINRIKTDMQKKYKEVNLLREEVTKVLLGESKFTSELLQELINQKESELTELNKLLSQVEQKNKIAQLENNESINLSIEINNWEERYDSSSIATKKMMLSRFIHELFIKKDEIYLTLHLPVEKALLKSVDQGSAGLSSTPVPSGMGQEICQETDSNFRHINTPIPSGAGGPGYTINCEINPNKHERGTLAMAHAGRNTGGSQFYICYQPQPHLDGQHTVFGKVTKGMEHVDAFRGNDRMESVQVTEV